MKCSEKKQIKNDETEKEYGEEKNLDGQHPVQEGPCSIWFCAAKFYSRGKSNCKKMATPYEPGRIQASHES
jgi:hypothetical protein